MRKTIAELGIVLILVIGCSQQNEVVSLAPEPGPAKKRATEAFQQFAKQLRGELEAAMKSGGPVNAVAVCSEKAPMLAEELSQQNGFQIGRSSHRLRNANNTANAKVMAYLEKHADLPAKDAKVEVVEVDDTWLVIAPIPAKPLCLTCHGDPDTMTQELKDALGKYYPEDKALNFKAGDLRGVFWAKLPQETDLSGKSLPLEESSRKIETH